MLFLTHEDNGGVNLRVIFRLREMFGELDKRIQEDYVLARGYLYLYLDILEGDLYYITFRTIIIGHGTISLANKI